MNNIFDWNHISNDISEKKNQSIKGFIQELSPII